MCYVSSIINQSVCSFSLSHWAQMSKFGGDHTYSRHRRAGIDFTLTVEVFPQGALSLDNHLGKLHQRIKTQITFDSHGCVLTQTFSVKEAVHASGCF